MPSLRELQTAFSDRMFDPALANTALQESIEEHAFSTTQRLQIYRNNIFITLTGALKNVYPETLRLVGDEFFVAVASEYVQTYPSASGNLDYFGEHFSEFLSTFPSLAAIPYVAEMAKFEWAYHLSYHAPGSIRAQQDWSLLSNLTEEQYGSVQLRLQPSVQLCSFEHPILTLWQYCQTEESEQSETMHLPSHGEQVLIHRPHDDVRILTLELGEFILLSGLQDGQSFAAACHAALMVESNLSIPYCVERAYALGIIADLHLG